MVTFFGTSLSHRLIRSHLHRYNPNQVRLGCTGKLGAPEIHEVYLYAIIYVGLFLAKERHHSARMYAGLIPLAGGEPERVRSRSAGSPPQPNVR
jgi:hypothetical protein